MLDRPGPQVPPAIAVAEAQIAETRRHLDLVMSTMWRELGLPIAAAAAATAAPDGAGGLSGLRDFVRRNALPLAVVAVGAGWLALLNRDRLAGAMIGMRGIAERVTGAAAKAGAAALAAALHDLAPPASDPRPPPTEETSA